MTFAYKIMVDTVSLTIDWRAASSGIPDTQQLDTQQPDTQREMQTQTLFHELRSLNSIETVTRVPECNVPPGAMGAQWLWGILTAEISVEALRSAATEVVSRLSHQPMELTIEVDGESQKIDAKNVRPGDFDEVVDKLVDAAQRLKASEQSAA
ncbi:MAG: hypothetical protein WA783_09285 [Phormidesmis sp.]